MYRFFFWIVLYCCIFKLSGQNGLTSGPEWQIKTCVNPGYVLIHTSSIEHLINGYPAHYELSIGKPTLGNKLWHLENNKPDVGLSFSCIDFKNRPQLGYAISLAPYIDIPLNHRMRASRPILRICWGISYLTKKFSISENRKNIAIGTHVNSFIQFKCFWHIKLGKLLRFEPGLAFSHVSNGRYRNPNLGLNVMSLNAGLQFLIPSKKDKTVQKIDSSTRVKSKNELLFFAAIGFNQYIVNTKTLTSWAYSLNYHRNIRNTHKFGAGVDVYYDNDFLTSYQLKNNSELAGINKFRILVKGIYSYNIGRISMPVEIGYYAFQKEAIDGDVMTRIAVRYTTRFGLLAQFGLRTHFAVAYDFEYGLGYRYYIKRRV
jgi:hypothetical protein